MFPRKTESVGVFLETEAEIVRSHQAFRIATNQVAAFEGFGAVALLSSNQAQLVIQGLRMRGTAQSSILERLEKQRRSLERWRRFMPEHRWLLRHTEVSCQIIEQQELHEETTAMHRDLSGALEESREAITASWSAEVENELQIAEQRGVPVFDDSL